MLYDEMQSPDVQEEFDESLFTAEELEEMDAEARLRSLDAT